MLALAAGLIALVVLGALPHSAVAQSMPSKDDSVAPVRFVSYNLRNFLRMDRRVDGESVKNAPKPESEVAPMMRYLSEIKPDMLGVSEIGDEASALEFKRRLAEAGLELEHMAWLQGGNSARCLAIYSRFPIVENHSTADLTYEIGAKLLPIQRGLLDVVIQVNEGYQLRVIGLHLKSKRPVSDADQAEMRRNEAHLARQRADAILAADPEVNLLVHGDLNSTRDEPPVKAVQGRWNARNYLKDVRLRDSHGTTWTYHWDYADQYSRFDFVLASRGLMSEVDKEGSYLFFDKDWYTASDHRPLVLSIHPENVIKP